MKRFAGHGIFDVAVIGGGISGAAVAYEAASRGLRVALFEKGDFGEATSAASSKLIHGGLRYLANREFGLVRESLRERRNLENIAPNFVYPLPFLLPHYRGALKTNKWFVRLGLTLYEPAGHRPAAHGHRHPGQPRRNRSAPRGRGRGP